MNKCIRTNKLCEKAREDGECHIGCQNCGYENWNTDIDELDLFDMLDEEEEL